MNSPTWPSAITARLPITRLSARKLEHLSPSAWGSYQAKRVHASDWF